MWAKNEIYKNYEKVKANNAKCSWVSWRTKYSTSSLTEGKGRPKTLWRDAARDKTSCCEFSFAAGLTSLEEGIQTYVCVYDVELCVRTTRNSLTMTPKQPNAKIPDTCCVRLLILCQQSGAVKGGLVYQSIDNNLHVLDVDD